MTNLQLVTELRKLHAEIVACDEGRESQMMALVRQAADALAGAAEPEQPRDAAQGVPLPITEHRYSQGEPGVWRWNQGCHCPRCHGEYVRRIAEQNREAPT